MRTYVVQRLLLALPTLVIVTMVLFAVTVLLPGDIAEQVAGPEATPEDVDRIRQELNLDDPWPVQYVKWLGHAATGDLGNSHSSTRVSVTELLRQRAPATVELAILSFLISLALSIPAGIFAAVKRNELPDIIVSMLAILGASVPSFVFGYLLVYMFAVKAHWLPASGYTALEDDPIANLKGLILPAVTLAAATLAAQTRMMRTSALDVLHSDYVRTARAKGLREFSVLSRHVARNAMVPFVTVVGLQVAYLLGGSVIVESIFALPGLGTLAVSAINGKDIPTIQGVVLVIIVVYLLVTILMDVTYALIDPRIRV